MPFTTKEIVQKHILDHHLGSTAVENERVRLSGSDDVFLQKKPILKDSERVKGKEQIEPTQESVSLAGSDTFALSHSELIPETIVMASDSSLGIIYLENVDYHIDYDIGAIRRLSSGSIPQGADLVIWYLYFRVYQRGVDYEIDYQKGSIRRRTSGDIESEQWLYIDYTAEYGSLGDEVLENAISEANDQIITFIDDSHRESTDRSLVDAETYLAVSIICRIRAMEAISPSRRTGSGVDARSWTALSETYKKEAYNFLSRFSGAFGSLQSPSKA